MNARELAGVREIEAQRDLMASRAAELAGELAVAKEQVAVMQKRLTELTTSGPDDAAN